ncbi:MAG: hypothetical protein J7551_06240 [Chloroflexi bacterium]|nr:hypothetical protein [Chloroflexota bacterium]
MRPNVLAWAMPLLIGMIIGTSLGLFYALYVDPRVIVDVNFSQLSEGDKRNVLVLLSLAYAQDRRVEVAAQRLLNLDKDWQAVADAACELAQTGYASTNTGLHAIRSMVELAGSQGYSSCASALIPIFTATPRPSPTPRPTATPTRPVVPTKTPTEPPPNTLLPLALQVTPTPRGAFIVASIVPFCDPRLPAVIEFSVRDANGNGIPAVPIEVRFGGARQRLFTGLKPERDSGYADFQMTPDEIYRAELPALSEPTRPLEASACTAQDGTRTRISYRVIFQRLR